jgi:hypothetical protein
VLVAAAVALAVSPAATACDRPRDATVLARSAKVVVWRRDKQVSACVKRTGRRVRLFDLGGRAHVRIVRLYLFGERVVAALAEHGEDYENGGTYHTTELVIFRLRIPHRLAFTGFLPAGFGDIPAMVRNRDGHFAWIVTRSRAGDCPCLVRAADTHESFLVSRRRHPIQGLRLRGSSVSFDPGGPREHVHVPFVDTRKFVPQPNPGGPHAKFRITVPLPGDLPPGGRVRGEIDEVQNFGTCYNPSEPHQEVKREPGEARIVYSRPDRHWCPGYYGGFVTYRWGDPRERGPCGPARPNCAGYLTFGHFRFHVRRATKSRRSL